MPRNEMPVPTTNEGPFWLARPNIDGETRIIFQTAKPHGNAKANAFSPWEVLHAANGEQTPLVLSPKEVLAQALAVGVANETAIAGLRKMLKQRTQDPNIRDLKSEYAIYGPTGRGMHQFGRW